MSNSPLITYTKLSPNRTSPRNHAIDTVSIHCAVGQLTAKQIVNLSHFVNYDPDNGASCNYAIGCDGSIALCVDEGDRSWCTSNRANDHRAITIEVASGTKHPYSVTDKAYQALIALLTDICMRNDIDELRWKGDKSLIGQPEKQNMTVHRWFDDKECPGEYLYSRHAKIAAEVNKRLANFEDGNKTEGPKPVETKPVTTAAIKEGDIVSIDKDAVYYNGSGIPNWVVKKQWIVKEVSGDRVVIDKSVDGKNAINSPVHAKYLTVVKNEAEADASFKVQVEVNNLNIRYGPGTRYAKTGKYTGKGIFTIVEVKSGVGSKAGWGKLKSGAGWISLDYTKKI